MDTMTVESKTDLQYANVSKIFQLPTEESGDGSDGQDWTDGEDGPVGFLCIVDAECDRRTR